MTQALDDSNARPVANTCRNCKHLFTPECYGINIKTHQSNLIEGKPASRNIQGGSILTWMDFNITPPCHAEMDTEHKS